MGAWGWWSKKRLLSFLQRLAPGPEGGCTVLCPPHHPWETLHPHSAAARDLLGEEKGRVQRWPMGVICFWSPERQIWILPPFSIAHAAVEATWNSPTFHALYARPVRFGLLLVRRGGYALGIAEGDTLCLHKVGSRYVQGRHRAGGSSARRFERRRREQVHHLLQEVCEEAHTRLEPHLPSLEALFLGGDRFLLGELQEQCTALAGALVHPHRLPVGEPRLEVLKQAVAMAWQSQVAFTGVWEGEG